MGYSTEFRGTIRIENMNLDIARKLKPFMGADKRDLRGHLSPKEQEDLPFYHFDIELSDDMGGLKWNGSEKTYGMAEMLNFLADKLGFVFKDGDYLLAQGEDFDDRYQLVVMNGKVAKAAVAEIGKPIVCPHCESKFIPGESV